MKKLFHQIFNKMSFRKILREIPLIYKIYRKLIFPTFLNNDLNIKYLRKFKFNVSLDVGANVGTYTVELQKNSKQVLCFEPLKRNIKLLKILINKNTKYFSYALGNANKSMNIKIPEIKTNQYDYALSSINNKFKKFKNEKIITKKFDDLLFKNFFFKKIDFIKIDVEGFEYFVLKGMQKTLKKNNPILLIEIEKRHNKSFMKTFKLLNNLGYKTYITKDGINLSFLSNEKINKFIKRKKYNNFFFVKNF